MVMKNISLSQHSSCRNRASDAQNSALIQVMRCSEETALPKPLPIRSSFSNLRPSSPLAGQKTPESTILSFSEGKTQSTPTSQNDLGADYVSAPYLIGQFQNFPFYVIIGGRIVQQVSVGHSVYGDMVVEFEGTDKKLQIGFRPKINILKGNYRTL